MCQDPRIEEVPLFVARQGAAEPREQQPRQRKNSVLQTRRDQRKHTARRGGRNKRKLRNMMFDANGRHDVDLTAEDLGFWTRTLQRDAGSIATPTPRPTPQITQFPVYEWAPTVSLHKH